MKTIDFKQESFSAYLTISRPKALNALNSQVFDDLEDCLSTLDKKIRVLIIKGAGDKSFVAGADIKEMEKLNAQQAEEFSKKRSKGVFYA